MRTPKERSCLVELECTGVDAHGPDLVDIGKGCEFCNGVRKQIADQIRLAVQEAVEDSASLVDNIIEEGGGSAGDRIRDHSKKAGY